MSVCVRKLDIIYTPRLWIWGSPVQVGVAVPITPKYWDGIGVAKLVANHTLGIELR